MRNTSGFRAAYGPWALVVGGSEGLGAEFARQLAAAGLNLVLVARRPDLLDRLADELRRRHGVQVIAVSQDMSDPGAVEAITAQTSDLEVGLLVCSAGVAPIGEFLELSRADHDRLLSVNCRVPALLAWELGRRMAQRGRGGIILLSSLAGFQGTGAVVHYAASKAYTRVLAEGLWNELHRTGVDALACCPGMVNTPTYLSEKPVRPGWLASPLMECGPVVTQTLRALGRKPVVVPGLANAITAWFTQWLLPRRARIALTSMGTRALYRARERDRLS